MKKLVTLLLVSLFASLAYAGLDPGTDSFGIYFDTAGNTNCTTAAPFQPVSAYLILMNPAGPTNGIECSVVMSGAPYVVLSTSCICPFEGCWFVRGRHLGRLRRELPGPGERRRGHRDLVDHAPGA